MRIQRYHSHLGGYEHMAIHTPRLWAEIADVVKSASPGDSWPSAAHGICSELTARGWSNPRVPVCPAPELCPDDWQTDFVKERIAVEVQLGKYAFVAYDLFVKHMAFFVGDLIDVGIEILPMKELQAEMSSGVPYYEGALYDLIRQGRGVPAVPLVLLGIAP